MNNYLISTLVSHNNNTENTLVIPFVKCNMLNVHVNKEQKYMKNNRNSLWQKLMQKNNHTVTYNLKTFLSEVHFQKHQTVIHCNFLLQIPFKEKRHFTNAFFNICEQYLLEKTVKIPICMDMLKDL